MLNKVMFLWCIFVGLGDLLSISGLMIYDGPFGISPTCEIQNRIIILGLAVACNVSALNETGDITSYSKVIFSIKYYCHSNQTSSLNEKLFEGMNRLVSIVIDNCVLTNLSDNVFKGLSTMQKLIIHGTYSFKGHYPCNASVLPENELQNKTICKNDPIQFFPGVFSKNKNLNHLAMTSIGLNNSIWTEIRELRSLLYMSLRDNFISDLENTGINKLPKLQTLDLSNNHIRCIRNETFKYQENLNDLDMSSNKLTEIQRNAFNGLVRLQKLNLAGNQIDTVCCRMFEMLEKLERLDLSGNKIGIIDQRAFQGLDTLLHLDLGKNIINRIHPGTFLHLSSLEKLFLSNNHISRINSDVFRGAGKLTLLELSNNDILAIDSEDDIVSINSSLQRIFMQHNNMTSINWLLYSDFPSLKIIDISNNRVHDQRIDFARLPRNLEELDISWNNIENLEIVISETSIGLHKLDARYNQIRTISITDTAMSAPSILISLFLGHNPFHCDCTLTWLQNLTTLRNGITDNFIIRDAESIYCQSVNRHEPGFIKDMKRENFLCQNNTSCPELCQCFYSESSNNVEIVDCKNITDFVNGIPSGCTVLDLSANTIISLDPGYFDELAELQELFMNSSQISEIHSGTFRNLSSLVKLDLSQNLLTTLQHGMFTGLLNLKELYLRSNEIKQVDKRTFDALTALKSLDIRDNRLTTISNAELNIFSRIQSVKLSRNPWSCDCGFLDIMKLYMNKNIKRIADFEDVTCRYYDKTSNKHINHFIMDINKPDFCVNDVSAHKELNNTLIIAISVVFSVVIVGLIIAILVLKHRKFLTLWFFVKFRWKCEADKDNDDINRPYDAFVSYSGKDADIVCQEIVPYLEEARSGREGYKLCVHDRDFLAGGVIAETIIDTIKRSKRVIVLVSNNYLRSEWCRFEFQRAHYQLVQEKRNRIIMILLEELDQSLIYEEIDHYLKTRTYVKYQDPRLWPKVEYAMPATNVVRNIGDHVRHVEDEEFIPLDFMIGNI